jgi:hypothetical protein
VSIPSSNFIAVVLLLELDIQCKLIDRYAKKLEEAASQWIQLEQGMDADTMASPIDIVAACTVCLSAMAAIRRLLFVCDRKGSKGRIGKRCAVLTDLLGNPSLPSLSSATVRNSWEHHDERIDDLLATAPIEDISPIYVAASPPQKDTVVLRRFDPVGFAIHFAGESISLRPCIEDAKLLAARITSAWARLQQERITV